MRQIVVEENLWPVVIIRFTGRQEDEDVVHFLKSLDSLYERGERFATITFMHSYNRNRVHIARIAAWMKANRELQTRFNVGSAIVATSSGFRFLLSTVLTLASIPMPNRVCSSTTEAVSYVSGQLRRNDLQVPPNLLQRLLPAEAVIGP